ncbi:Mbeg1-like protein [Bradyrhizobium sp. URHD0069]|uniref:lipase family protein n=1 Tax=Bradyrhizobium sp. URHD0069 TaxID=1380355 RepID=UPI000497A0E2|nr:lipase family protein [Bradyrhizobium sp. URHD0069]
MTFLVRLPRSEYPTDAFAGFGLGEFTLLTARAGAWLAQLAYEDEPAKINAIASDWGLETVALFKPATKTTLLMARTRGFVLRGRGAHFVAFAGTDPLVTANWIANFDFALDEDGIHQGFGNALDSAWKDIGQALGAEHWPEHLILAGHSLGGALAVLAAERALRELRIKADAVYTYGMPRVGGPTFAERYNQALGHLTYRLVHGADIVPTLPPAEIGFSHVGRPLACDRYGKFDALNLFPFPSDVPMFVTGALNGVRAGLLQIVSGLASPEIRDDALGQASRLLLPAIADHLPDRYWRALS